VRRAAGGTPGAGTPGHWQRGSGIPGNAYGPSTPAGGDTRRDGRDERAEHYVSTGGRDGTLGYPSSEVRSSGSTAEFFDVVVLGLPTPRTLEAPGG
jgi:hypothetical protein